MSLRVRHLNGDTSFLLTFSPPYAPANAGAAFPGSFTLLFDPWLVGASTVFSSKFAQSTRTIPSCVASLQDLPEPDVVLVSQDKSDHCHRETLTQLAPDTDALIYGPAAAVRKIRSWKHFDPNSVHALPRYDEKHDDSVIRIPIPAPSKTGTPGEVTIAFLVAKVDISGLHNAICVTYRPPSTVLSSNALSYVTLPQSAPMTPPDTPPHSHPPSHASLSSTNLFRHTNGSTLSISRPKTPQSTSGSLYSLNCGPREKAISVLYSPHGLSYDLVKTFATNHLLSESALPLTALFHSLDRTDNPWYLGGNIMTGYKGGLEIARGLSARCWIGAHDEDKDNSGFSTKQLKVERGQRTEIRRLLDQEPNSRSRANSHASKKSKSSVRVTATDLVELDTGAEYFISSR